MPLNCNLKTQTSVITHAKQFLDKSLTDVLPQEDIAQIIKTKNKRNKGNFGNIVEEYLFGLKSNIKSEPDFLDAGIELKTSPLLKNKDNQYAPKERLIFSKINYKDIIFEEWATSSFLKKNKLLLLMFYLYKKNIDIENYEFKIIELLDLISHPDAKQIEKDWNVIVDKINRGEAHLLSEGDTSYLGAATKGATSADRTEQPNSSIKAKPRAFSLKQSYLRVLIRNFLEEKDKNTISFIDEHLQYPLTIEENIAARIKPYINKTAAELEKDLKVVYKKGRPKQFRRMIIDKMFGLSRNTEVQEFQKANITLKVVAIEPSGKLKESVSFPAFDYKKIIKQKWHSSDFYSQLNNNRFLFIVFRKDEKTDDVLAGIKFWNFSVSTENMEEAKNVWEKAIKCIQEGNYTGLPKIKESPISHVRPHGRNKKDTLLTPQGTKEVKRCFWINAKHVEKFLKEFANKS